MAGPGCSLTTENYLRLKGPPAFAIKGFHPLGETDLEYAFCPLLDVIATSGNSGEDSPPAHDLVEMIGPYITELNLQ